MRDIYASASQTIIWLGKSDHDSEVALDGMSSVAEYDHHFFFKQMSSSDRSRFWSDETWASFCKLFERPWFRRRWIIQEAAVPKDPWVICGSKTMPWTCFQSGIDRCTSILYEERLTRPHPPTLTTDIDEVSAMGILRNRRNQTGVTTNMLELLTRFRRNDTTVPSDRIYAILGLCGPAEALATSVDYTVGVEEIFIQAAINHISIFRDLDILNACTEASRIERREHTYQTANGLYVFPDNPRWARGTALPSLPTWAPNWTSPHAEWVLRRGSMDVSDNFEPLFHASGNLSAQVLNLSSAAVTSTLKTVGVEIDRIAKTCDSTPPAWEWTQRHDAQVFEHMFFLACDRNARYTPYETDQARFNAFLRTITAGGYRPGTRACFSTSYLGYACLQFFRPARFGSFLHTLGFREDERPPDHQAYENPDDAATFTFTALAPIQTLFAKLCFFKFCLTIAGRIVLVPPHTKAGDRLVVLFGGSSPLVLYEEAGRPDGLCIRGEAYVDGCMNGEAITMVNSGIWRRETFTLV